MSMNLNVYVGPYLEVSGVDKNYWWEFENLVVDAVMEGPKGEDGTSYLIANRKIEGIERQLIFNEYEYHKPMTLMKQDVEILAMEKSLGEFIEAARSAGATVVSTWGVICGCW